TVGSQESVSFDEKLSLKTIAGNSVLTDMRNRYAISSLMDTAYWLSKQDAAFEVKEPKFEGRKPESEVHVSLNSSAQTKKHDDKTKREAKGKSHVELLTRYRNLSTKFEDFSDNSINEVNAADTSVPAVG
nr:hypothetical protein [Tanacetum cinerariifolium]